ncbi:acetyltransferase [Motilimonas cestriensis]|uniref:acetyltransferase n=1 Tax=Motilimonas cestriensis TaxID=2742685 RepID=UPI003DA3EC67
MSSHNLKPLIIIGGGGHASVLVDILRSQDREILAVVSPDDIAHRSVFIGIKHLKNDDDLLAYRPNEVVLVNGIGMMPRTKIKRKINEKFLSLGYRFETVIADSSIISEYASLGEGVQVLPGAIIQAGAVIGEYSIINSGAIIEHDTQIGCYNHIAPGSVICGQCVTKEDVFVGAGATVIQSINIAEQAFVAVGATVTTNMPASSICYPSRSQITQGDL